MDLVTMVLFTIIGSSDGSAVSHSVSQVPRAACERLAAEVAEETLVLPATSQIRGSIGVEVLCIDNE